jgi:uncharacterized protein
MGPVDDIATFAGALRGRGLAVTPDQTADMALALLLVDPGNRRQVYAALRCLAVHDYGQIAAFDEEFTRFFGGSGTNSTVANGSESTLGANRAPLFHPVEPREEGEGTKAVAASAIEKLGERDFSNLDDDDLIAARQMVAAMLWVPSELRTRRWRPSQRGSRPDIRRSFREATQPRGDLMQFEMRDRRMKQRPLIIIADISGSMEKYAEVLLVFAHAATRRLRQVETFTFSTRLTRITEEMERRDTKAALRRVTRSVSDWSGGTKIGSALADWNRVWSRRMARGGPVALIFSDGWDCGDPEVLSREMARLSRSVHRVLWLNPLAGRPGYEPATRGMQAVLPHIDHLLPAASVNDLRDIVRLLEKLEVRSDM